MKNLAKYLEKSVALLVFGAMIVGGVWGLVALAAPTAPQEVPPAPRALYEGVLPDGQVVILVVDCERLFDATQALANALAAVAADSAGAACVHPALAVKVLAGTELPTKEESAP